MDSGTATKATLLASTVANDGKTPRIITFNNAADADTYLKTYANVADQSTSPGTNARYVESI